MKFVFNELCVSDLKAFSQDDFNQWLNSWLDLLAYSRRLFKEEPNLYSRDSKMELLPDSIIRRWLDTVSRDKKMLFYGLKDRHPYLEKRREPKAYEEFLVSDYSYEGKQANGLGTAYLLDGIAFSFPSDSKWDKTYLNLQVCKIDNDDCESVFEVKVRHAIQKKHLDSHKQFMKSFDACLEKIKDLSMLRSYWNDEFPHLEQSNTVFATMEKTPLSPRNFEKVVENLFNLNQFLDSGETDIRKLRNCSDESDTTKQKYGETREFSFGTVRRRCYFHLKLWEMNWRIHFDVDYKKRIAYVGAIWKHPKI